MLCDPPNVLLTYYIKELLVKVSTNCNFDVEKCKSTLFEMVSEILETRGEIILIRVTFA